jgi:hypothetical protein
MPDLEDIRESGKAPNDQNNATTGEAEAAAKYFGSLFEGTHNKVDGLYINTTVGGPVNAELIPLEDVDPKPPDSERFYYHVEVSNGPAGTRWLWCVASWLTAIEVRGLETATRDYLVQLDPGFTYLTTPYTYEAINDSLTTLYAESSD